VKKRGLSMYEGIILASIVQKETFVEEEYPVVASVFYNRLRKNMRLQSDPTIIYGMGDRFDGNIKKSDLLDKNNRYNTYTINGLPPTPISNPSKGALEGVMNLAETDFLYFVAKKDGTHIFAKSYEEHLINVKKYQMGR
ncbi:MAG: endolytic transglycosylase MltG, partial [Calditerrivibrio sp.]|nr:endolytic transglycosylase MltG [Calditerrivibrio sp.]